MTGVASAVNIGLFYLSLCYNLYSVTNKYKTMVLQLNVCYF